MSKETAQNTNSSQPLKITDAAKLLGVSRSTLMRLEEKGEITSARLSNSYRVFYTDDVVALKGRLGEIKQDITKPKAVSKEEMLVHLPTTVMETGAQTANVATTPDTSASVQKETHKIKPTYVSSAPKIPILDRLFKSLIKLSIGFAMITFLIINIAFLKSNIPTMVGDSEQLVLSVFKNYSNTFKDNVLAYKTSAKNFRYVFNVPSVHKKDVFVEDFLTVKGNITSYSDLNVEGLSSLLGGVFTPSITGLESIDDITENTLESRLGLRGDVYSDSLNEVYLGDGIVDEEKLAEDINYEGNFNFMGTWMIGGVQVTATAKDLNKIDSLKHELTSIEELEALAGGIAFGNGSSLVTDYENFYWDAANLRLGILNDSPAATFSVGQNSEFRIESDGSVRMADLTTLDLSEIDHSDAAIQGFRLPISADVPTTMTGAGAGYIAYNSTSGGVMVFDGADWNNVTADVTLQTAYTLGPEITMTNGAGPLRILSVTDEEILFLHHSSGNVGVGTTNPQYKLQVDGTADVASLRFATGAVDGYILVTDGSGMAYWDDPNNAASPWNVAGLDIYPDFIENNIGIGNTAPAYKLDVTGTVRISSGSDLILEGENLRGTQLGNRLYAEENYVVDLETFTASVNSLDIALHNLEIGSTGLWLDSSDNSYIHPADTALVVITDTGNIGIGTTAPSSELEIAGNITLGDDNWIGEGASLERISFDSDGNDIELLDANVGIGTTDPTYLLDVNGDIRVASGSDYYLGTIGFNDNASTSSGAGLIGLFDDTYSNIAANTTVQGAIGELDSAIGNRAYTNNYLLADSQSVTASLDAVDSAIGNRAYTEDNYVTDAQSLTASVNALDMMLQNVVTGSTGLWIDTAGYIYAQNASNVVISDTGNLGIGTTNPIYALDVAGDIRVASGSDYYLGTIGFNDNASTSSGAGLIGLFDDTYSNIAANTTVQGAIGELDSAIGNRAYTEDNYVTDAQSLTASVNALDMMLQNVVTGSTGLWIDTAGYIYAQNASNVVISDTGNLGIGTTNPIYALDVAGDIRVASGSDYYLGTIGFNDNASTSSGAGLIGLFDDTYSNIAANTTVQGAIGELDSAIGNRAYTNNYLLADSQSVTASLDAVDSAIGNRAYTEDNYVTDAQSLTASVNALDMMLQNVVTGSTGLWIDTAGYIYAQNASNVVISDTGNLGIGTTNPIYALDVAGDIRVALGSDLFITTAAGNIGLTALGTDESTSGASLIAVFDEYANSNALNVQGVLDDLDWAITSGFSKWTDGGATTYLTDSVDNIAVGGTGLEDSPFFIDNANELLTLTNTTGGLSFRVNDEALDTTPFVIDGNGNVGIGLSTPGYSLEVGGTARINGNFTIGDDFW